MSAGLSRRGGIALLVVATLSWGVSTTLSDYALEELTAPQLLVLELLLGAAAIWAVVLVRSRRALRARRWPFYATLGLVEPALTFVLANEGLERASASTAALLFSLETAFVVVLAVLILRERIPPALAVVLVIALAGGAAVGAGTDPGRDTVAGIVLVLASALAAATYTVLARRWAHGAPALVITAYQLAAALLVALPFALPALSGPALAAPDAAHWWAAVAAGVSGVAVPFLLFNVAIARVEASVAAVLLNFVPLAGFATAVAFRGDDPRTLQIAGGVLILAAVTWLGRRESQRPPARARLQRPEVSEASA